jgi:soluble lytic murein transglycosylase
MTLPHLAAIIRVLVSKARKQKEESGVFGRQHQQRLPKRTLAVFLISLCALASSAFDEVRSPGEVVRLPVSLQNKFQNYSASVVGALKDFERGVDWFAKERYASALEALPGEKEAKATAIGDYILLYRAKSYLMMDQGKEALENFRLLRRQYTESPVSRDALIGESLSLLKIHEPGAALSLLRSPELDLNSEILYYQARALEEAGEKERAIGLYLQVYAKYPGSSFSPQAIRYLLALSPGAFTGRRNYDARLQRAENLVKAGNAHDAQVLLLALGKVPSPDSKSSQKRLLLLGEAEYRLNKAAAAIGHLRGVTAADPELHSRAIYLEGACSRKLDNESSFLELRAKALKLYPQSSETEELCYSAATYYDVNYDSTKAWRAYQTLYENFPKGKHAERALWKLALFPYFDGKYKDAALAFWDYLLAYPDPLSASSAIYWMGRCYQKLGDFEHAKYLHSQARQLANDSYYGWCAREEEASLKKADSSGKSAAVGIDFEKVVFVCEKIQYSTISIQEPDQAVNRVIERARQLQEAGVPDLAISELRWGIRRNPKHQESLCYLMARIYGGRDDHNEAIACLRRAFPDYNFRPGNALPEEIWRMLFPVRYWETISVQSARSRLEPTLVLGVIRQESGFEEKARSKANARGLMQILPSTGKKLAKQASLRSYSVKKLYQAETNITLGVRYLASLIRQYGKEELALAAYNAGDTRVDRWLRAFGNVDMAEFVEQIPFSETRGYVKQVLSNKAHYSLLTSPAKY